MAEVSASAVAVERLARQGRLDLQPAVVTQEAGHEEEEEDEEEEEEEDNNHDEEGDISQAVGDRQENNLTRSNCSDGNLSSQQVRENLEKNTTLETPSSGDTAVNDNLEPKQIEELVSLVEEETAEQTLSSADIEDMRENLVSASQEAQQLLSDLSTRWFY